MALANDPVLLIADEPTTALDVTIQAQVLDLLKDLQRRLGMAILLISHNLGVVRHMADEVHVMQEGRIVESGPRDVIFTNPRHPIRQLFWPALRLVGRIPWPKTRKPCLRQAGCGSGFRRARPFGAAPKASSRP
jgi:ABC-type uncharacterized transport system, duplicated ATPase component